MFTRSNTPYECIQHPLPADRLVGVWVINSTMKIAEIINELKLPKNKWETLISTADKEEAGHDLIGLVQSAYAKTTDGSFINQLHDIIPSDWAVIDWDDEPDVDACVFYRRNRPGENWIGYKIQGLGHDGTRTSKDKAINKIQQMLAKPGVWVESSDAMRRVLKGLNVASINDVEFLRKLFDDDSLEMVDNDTYHRKLSSNKVITETVFGNPILKETK